ncbi:MAG: DnaD domain protein [Clostridia bacterium]|nr:DnaD domain protein [Clostridia bacterium]
MFCKFGNEMNESKATVVDNYFITECMPYANSECIKIYLYGLYKCQSNENNTLKDFANELMLSEKEVEEAFWYWQQEGLVRVIEQNPIEIIYLPSKNRKTRKDKFNESKYEDFILGVQSYFEGVRQILPTEFSAYIEVMERFKMDQMAMLRIIKYCIDYKDKSVGYPYIVQVAKNWAYGGILNLNAVEEKIKELGLTDEKLLDVLKTLGIRRSATLDEKQLYVKWTKTFGFLYETIIYVAKTQKKKGGTNKLDFLLTKYFEQKLFSEAEILEFETNRQQIFSLAKKVSVALGKYYEVYDNVVDTYILPWKNKGYEDKTLETIANLCFKSSVRTLEGMDNYIQKLFKLGLVTEDSIFEYINNIQANDSKINEIFEKLGISKKIRQNDRELYKTWTQDWKISEELIHHSIPLCLGKENSLSYLNKVLSNYKDKGIYTLELLESNKNLQNAEKTTNTNSSKLKIYSYTDEELTAMFENLDEVEI